MKAKEHGFLKIIRSKFKSNYLLGNMHKKNLTDGEVKADKRSKKERRKWH